MRLPRKTYVVEEDNQIPGTWLALFALAGLAVVSLRFKKSLD